MHEPSASSMGDGYFVNFKLDHHRNYAFDDFADVRIETDHEGKPTKDPIIIISLPLQPQ